MSTNLPPWVYVAAVIVGAVLGFTADWWDPWTR